MVEEEEMARGRVTIRNREGENLGVMEIDQAISTLKTAAQTPDIALRESEKVRLLKSLLSHQTSAT